MNRNFVFDEALIKLLAATRSQAGDIQGGKEPTFDPVDEAMDPYDDAIDQAAPINDDPVLMIPW